MSECVCVFARAIVCVCVLTPQETGGRRKAIVIGSGFGSFVLCSFRVVLYCICFGSFCCAFDSMFEVSRVDVRCFRLKRAGCVCVCMSFFQV